MVKLRGTVLVFVILLFMWATSPAHADGRWFASVAAGYAPHRTPWSEQMDEQLYSWKGSNPVAQFEVGREWKNVSVFYQHTSNWLRGFPFTDEHETALDMVVVKYKWTW